MSIYFQTNYASLVAENNLNTNTNFQTQAIEQLTSGYRSTIPVTIRPVLR